MSSTAELAELRRLLKRTYPWVFAAAFITGFVACARLYSVVLDINRSLELQSDTVHWGLWVSRELIAAVYWLLLPMFCWQLAMQFRKSSSSGGFAGIAAALQAQLRFLVWWLACGFGGMVLNVILGAIALTLR